MKPDVKTAMEDLIKDARGKIPFNLSFSGNCEGRCEECPYKLLEYLDMDLCSWENRLKKGEIPSAANLYALASDCKRIYAILLKQGLVQELPP
ncbi:MAG: hypothetical protein KGJ95_03545 [Candidatus Omnitrophica bacterium]|nr:hypothetical protein [Candidatus Omnitrophota bacterium]MDE2231122.1 hypothetical protein [Candidatus Omnitrophota bacterium]